MATVKVEALRLRTIIGTKKDEREKKQDVVIDFEFTFDAVGAAESDDINKTIDYKSITKAIIKLVEESEFFLLETLSREVLRIIISEPKVLFARVEVAKPHALRFSDSVSVISYSTDEMNIVAIGVGSNISPKENVKKAQKMIEDRPEFQLVKTSPFIETEPIGTKEDTKFVNGAFLVRTTLSYHETKETLRIIEKDLGRKRDPNNKNAPRTIDLDILTWNNTIVDGDFYERDFLKDSIFNLIPNISDK